MTVKEIRVEQKQWSFLYPDGETPKRQEYENRKQPGEKAVLELSQPHLF